MAELQSSSIDTKVTDFPSPMVAEPARSAKGKRARDKLFVILAGGRILDYHALEIPSGSFVIAADSGYRHTEKLGIIPDLIVGDFDSADLSIVPTSIPRIKLDPAKNHTDTTHAIGIALERGARQLLVAGALGGRLDHTMSNVQDLAYLSRKGVTAKLTDGLTSIYAITDDATTIAPEPNSYLSLFSLSSVCENVTVTHAAWELRNFTLTFDHPRAVSNEFTDLPVKISVSKGTLCIMVVPKDQ